MMILPVRGLTDSENDALKANLAQLQEKRPRALKRTDFYNTKKILDQVGFSIPPSMRNLEAVLGWPTKAVDGLSSKLHLHGFVDAKSADINEDLELIWTENRMATEWPQGQTSTLLHGCSFVATTPGDTAEGEPEVMVQPMAATEATGIWDVRKRRLSSGIWLPHDPTNSVAKLCVLFTKENTVTMTRDANGAGGLGPWQIKRTPNPLPWVPLTPVVHRAQLGRPFGMSRLSRSVVYLCQMAARTLLRTEVGAEFFNAPQRYAMGATAEDFEDENGNTIAAWETVLGRIWLIGRDEEGNIPTVGQFAQQSMAPNVEMMKMIATLFAGETSLPVSSLGVVHDNPASAEAIDAAWADMTGLAELCQVEMGQSAVEVAQNALMIKNKQREMSDDLKRIKAKWRDASTPTQAAQTDAVTKQIAAGVLLPDSTVALEKMNYDAVDIGRIQAEHAKRREEDDKALAAMSGSLNGGTDAAGNPTALPGQSRPTARSGAPVAPGVPAARPAPPGR